MGSHWNGSSTAMGKKSDNAFITERIVCGVYVCALCALCALVAVDTCERKKTAANKSYNLLCN